MRQVPLAHTLLCVAAVTALAGACQAPTPSAPPEAPDAPALVGEPELTAQPAADMMPSAPVPPASREAQASKGALVVDDLRPFMGGYSVTRADFDGEGEEVVLAMGMALGRARAKGPAPVRQLAVEATLTVRCKGKPVRVPLGGDVRGDRMVLRGSSPACPEAKLDVTGQLRPGLTIDGVIVGEVEGAPVRLAWRALRRR